MLALFYGTASNPSQQSTPAARNLDSYDWSCAALAQSSVDSVVDAMYDDMLAKEKEKKTKMK